MQVFAVSDGERQNLRQHRRAGACSRRGKGVYFCVTKSTKSQQRRASRPPLQTSAHLRECAAGSMRAYLVRPLDAKNNPAERKSKLFLISKSALSARMIRYICGIFLSPAWAIFRLHLSPPLPPCRACEHRCPRKASRFAQVMARVGSESKTTKSFVRLFQKGLTHVRSTCVGVAETGPRPTRAAVAARRRGQGAEPLSHSAEGETLFGVSFLQLFLCACASKEKAGRVLAVSSARGKTYGSTVGRGLAPAAFHTSRVRT